MRRVRRERPRGGARRWWRGILRVGIGGAVLFLAASFYVEFRYRGRIRSVADSPSAPVALVFGAGLAAQGTPSPILAERLDAAVALYREGKVEHLLLSGDNTARYHDETSAMRRYVLDKGIPAADVSHDWAGVSTYDSIVRAKGLYAVTHALLVTQRFHLPRALFIANSLGLEAEGVAADRTDRRGSPYALRELVSRPFALAQVLTGASPAYSVREQRR